MSVDVMDSKLFYQVIKQTNHYIIKMSANNWPDFVSYNVTSYAHDS